MDLAKNILTVAELIGASKTFRNDENMYMMEEGDYRIEFHFNMEGDEVLNVSMWENYNCLEEIEVEEIEEGLIWELGNVFSLIRKNRFNLGFYEWQWIEFVEELKRIFNIDEKVKEEREEALLEKVIQGEIDEVVSRVVDLGCIPTVKSNENGMNVVFDYNGRRVIYISWQESFYIPSMTAKVYDFQSMIDEGNDKTLQISSTEELRRKVNLINYAMGKNGCCVVRKGAAFYEDCDSLIECRIEGEKIVTKIF